MTEAEAFVYRYSCRLFRIGCKADIREAADFLGSVRPGSVAGFQEMVPQTIQMLISGPTSGDLNALSQKLSDSSEDLIAVVPGSSHIPGSLRKAGQENVGINVEGA
jgi:hypothetical protein